jgi:uncharacterized small protein (DUF1192 family)
MALLPETELNGPDGWCIQVSGEPTARERADSALSPDVLASRIRRTAATLNDPDEIETPASLAQTLAGLNASILRDSDAALSAQSSTPSAASGRFRWLKRIVRRLVESAQSDRTQVDIATMSAVVGVNDKATAIMLRVDELETRLAALEAESRVHAPEGPDAG